jgi:hypothetical protein
MPLSGTGERVTSVLDFPSRDGLPAGAIRVDYEPPGTLHSPSRNASGDVPASLIAFFVPGDGESATGHDRV